MKVGLDYAAMVGGGGNAVYSRSLIEAILNSDNSNQYYMYAFVHDVFRGRTKEFRKYPNVHIRPVYVSKLGLPIPKILIRILGKVLFYIWSFVDQVDVFHFTNPLYYQDGFQHKSVITIHDLAGLHGMPWAKEDSVLFIKQRGKEMMDKASKIIAVSTYTKTDIVNSFGINPEKVSVIYEAAGSNFYPDNDPVYLEEKFGLATFMLYVGQLQPRKNIVGLLTAYSGLSNELRDTFNLVLVGTARDKKYAVEIQKMLVEYGLTKQVKMLGRVDDISLRKLYSGARIFLFPSFFEGFGLPVIEALKCGTPVITSNNSSLPEVLGDAGILVDAEKIDDLSCAMDKLLSDGEFFSKLKTAAILQAQKFSWKKAAQETLAEYQKLQYN